MFLSPTGSVSLENPGKAHGQSRGEGSKESGAFAAVGLLWVWQDPQPSLACPPALCALLDSVL